MDARAFTILWFLSGIAGCQAGVFAIPYAESKYVCNDAGTGCGVQITGWGLIVDTNADAGMVLGWTRKTYFFHGQCSAANAAVNVPQERNRRKTTWPDIHDPRLRLRPCDESEQAATRTVIESGAPPIAYVSQSAGVALHANRGRVSLVAGINRFATLRIPMDFDGIVILLTQTPDAQLGLLHVRPEIQP